MSLWNICDLIVRILFDFFHFLLLLERLDLLQLLCDPLQLVGHLIHRGTLVDAFFILTVLLLQQFLLLLNLKHNFSQVFISLSRVCVRGEVEPLDGMAEMPDTQTSQQANLMDTYSILCNSFHLQNLLHLQDLGQNAPPRALEQVDGEVLSQTSVRVISPMITGVG